VTTIIVEITTLGGVSWPADVYISRSIKEDIEDQVIDHWIEAVASMWRKHRQKRIGR
jgi:hypothetical protein